MNKKISLILLLISIFFLPACGFKDIDKRFFVTQMGVDLSGKKDEPYKVVLKLAIPKPQIEPGQEQFQIVEQNSATITQAVRLIKSKVDKELDFGHCKVIVFGEKLARKDIKTPMDWFARRRDIQKIAYVAIGKPNAKKILEIKPQSERLPGNAMILSFGESGTESSYIITEYLFDFYRRLYAKGLDPVMPVVEQLSKTNYDIRRVAVFNKKKLVKILTSDDTRLLNELSFSTAKFDAVPETKGIKLAISFEKLKIKHHVVTPKKGPPFIGINASVQGIVEEADHPIEEKQWGKYEQETADTYKKRYLELVKRLQRLNIDPIGFGEDYLAGHFHGEQSWREWQSLYPKIHFHIQTSVRIKATGNIY